MTKEFVILVQPPKEMHLLTAQQVGRQIARALGRDNARDGRFIAEAMPSVIDPTAKQSDDEQTAAWYGRGEKPEHEPLDWVPFDFGESVKSQKPGLLTVQGEGRYQGLGFNGGE